MAYIGLDVGTTGSKATVISREGEILLSGYYEYNLQFPQTGWVEMDANAVWQAVQRALAEAAAKYGGPIEAIATASFGEAAVLLDKNDMPLANSIFFSDVRGNEQMPRLRSAVDVDQLQQRTGLPLNSMYTLPKLLWIQQHQPQLLEKARRILLFGSYINYMLSGEAGIDASLASRTLMFDRRQLAWDKPALQAFGIEKTKLPRFVPAGQPVGRMTAKLAKALGFGQRPLIVSGVHDQIAAALGAGAIHAGDVSDGIGGAECIHAVLPEDINMQGLFHNNICAEPHAVPGRYVALAFSNTAGAALKWYRDTFEETLAAQCQKSGQSAYAQLNRQMGKKPSPLLFAPYLAGSGTPHLDAQAKGVVCGLTLGTKRTDIYRAILEGMSFEIRYNLDILRQNGLVVDALTAGGGGAAPDALQIKADILQLPIHTLKNPQSGTTGLGILCGLATGQFPGFEQAAQAMVKRDQTIEPKRTYARHYQTQYGRYVQLYGMQKALYGAQGR